MRNKSNKGIIVLGNGGHARTICDLVNSINTYSISARGRLKVQECIPWEDGISIPIPCKFIVGFGSLDNINKRWQCFQEMKENGGVRITLISPHAVVSQDAIVEEGTVIMARAYVGPGARIGPNCIINTEAIIEHDTTIGANCHISTGAIVNGGCAIFDNVLVGSGAVVKQGLRIFHDNTIGCGAAVVKNIPGTGGVYVGVPATNICDRGSSLCTQRESTDS